MFSNGGAIDNTWGDWNILGEVFSRFDNPYLGYNGLSDNPVFRNISWLIFGASDYKRVLYDGQFFGNEALPQGLTTFFATGMGGVSLGGVRNALVRKSLLTTEEGFLLGSIQMKAPFNISVQRFGNMSLTRLDFWGLRIGTNRFVNRTFAAIKPSWNPLTQFTRGIIPKGTPIKFGIIGPQGLKYPGGLVQFLVNGKHQPRRFLASAGCTC